MNYELTRKIIFNKKLSETLLKISLKGFFNTFINYFEQIIYIFNVNFMSNKLKCHL